MDVQTILETKGDSVVTMASDGSIADAAQHLVSNDIGVVVVTGGEGELNGIISERDISRAVAENGGSLCDRSVGELMESRVVTCELYASIVNAIVLMNTYQARHLPVVDDDKLVGIISMRDVSEVWQKAMEVEIERLQRSLA